MKIIAYALVLAIAFCWARAISATEVRYSDYSMLGKRHASLLADVNGVFASENVIVPVSANISHVHWRAPGAQSTYWEVFELKDNPATSTRWWFLTAFCSPGGCDQVTTQAATLEIGGQAFDIGRPEVPGHPYAPELFTAPYTVTIRGRTGPVPFYWRAAMSMPTDVTSTFWRTDAVVTRPAIRQDEAWWSLTGGWEQGASETAWSRSGYLGKGAGIGYVGEMFGWKSGLAWAWKY